MCNGGEIHTKKRECMSQQEPHDMSANTNTCNKKTTASNKLILIIVSAYVFTIAYFLFQTQK